MIALIKINVVFEIISKMVDVTFAAQIAIKTVVTQQTTQVNFIKELSRAGFNGD